MFDIIIKTGNDAAERVVFCGECRNDWQRADMARAIELALGAPGGATSVFVLANEAGNPACRGKLVLWVWAIQEWICALGALLEGAHWGYETRVGYGAFIDRLLVLKADWRFAQTAA
jgi:hypothetical protein